MSTENYHWATDEELRERFVTERISGEEYLRFRQHLSECESCSELIRAEQLLVAGIKRAGREELQSRLRARISNLPQRTWSWYQISGAAAVILVLLTLGIHQLWFIKQTGDAIQGPILTEERAIGEKGETNKSEQEATADALSSPDKTAEQSKEAPGKSQGAIGHTNGQVTAPSTDIVKEEEGLPKGKGVRGEQAEKKQTLTDDKFTIITRREPETERAQVAAGAANEKTITFPSGRNDLSEADERLLTAQLREIESEYAIPPTISIGSVAAVMDEREKGKGDRQRQLLRQQVTEPRMQAIVDDRIQAVQKPGIQFHQQSTIDIALHQRYTSKSLLTALRSDGLRTIPAYFTFKNSTVIVLLLVNPLFDESSIRAATAELVKSDSLIIIIEGKSLGYRLPDRLRAQLPGGPDR